MSVEIPNAIVDLTLARPGKSTTYSDLDDALEWGLSVPAMRVRIKRYLAEPPADLDPRLYEVVRVFAEQKRAKAIGGEPVAKLAVKLINESGIEFQGISELADALNAEKGRLEEWMRDVEGGPEALRSLSGARAEYRKQRIDRARTFLADDLVELRAVRPDLHELYRVCAKALDDPDVPKTLDEAAKMGLWSGDL